MAKIENTTVYPTVLPTADDLLIATDTSDDNKTVTFLVSSLIAPSSTLQGLQSVLDTGNIATQTMTLTGDIQLLGGAGTGFIDLCQIKLGGSYGAAGQVVTSNGAGVCASWETPAATSCCSWNDTLLIGATATTASIVQGVKMTFINGGGGIDINAPATLTNSGLSIFTGEVQINGTELNFNATGQISDGSGSTGGVGDILTATATGVEWSSTIPSSLCCNLQDTLTSGNTATGIGISMTAISPLTLDATSNITSSGTNTWNGTNTFTADIEVDGTIEDGAGAVGAAGEILSSTGVGVAWIAPATLACCNLENTLAVGNTAINNMGLTGTLTVTGAVVLGGSTLSASGSVGLAGNLLSSTGAGTQWIAASTLCCDLQDTLDTGNSANQNITLTTAGNTITAPLLDPDQIVDTAASVGLAGEILSSTGTGLAWIPPSGGVSSNLVSVTAKFFAREFEGGGPGAYTYHNQMLSDLPVTTINQLFDNTAVTGAMAQSGIIYMTPHKGNCGDNSCKKTICSVKWSVGSDVQLTCSLYKIDMCGGAGPEPWPQASTEAVQCIIPAGAVSEPVCCEGALGLPADIEIEDGQGYLLVVTPAAVPCNFQGVVTLQMLTSDC